MCTALAAPQLWEGQCHTDVWGEETGEGGPGGKENPTSRLMQQTGDQEGVMEEKNRPAELHRD